MQNPKWWGTPANARSITVRIASSTAQLTQWMTSGYVQVAQPSTVTPAFLTQMTGLPGVQSEVDTSATLLQLDMASSLDSQLSPDLRAAIALSINRQDLVNQQVSWAVPGIAVADSHVYVQGQPNYKPASASSVTTTVPAPTSSTSTTVIGAGGSVNFPTTPVPDQAATFITASGLVRTPGVPYYHSAFGIPFMLRLVVDGSDPWAAAAAPVIRSELQSAGLDTSLVSVNSATAAGQVLASGFADLALVPVTFSALPEPDVGVVHAIAGPGGKERLAGLDGLRQRPLQPAGEDGLTAAQSEHGGRLLRPGRHTAVGRDGLAAVVRRADRAGVEPDHRRGVGGAAERQPALVRTDVGGAHAGVHQQHDAVAAGAIGPGAARLRSLRSEREAILTRYDLRTLRSNRRPVGVAE